MNSARTISRFSLVTALFAVAMLAGPSTSLAATAGLSGGVLTISGATGETNNVTVTPNAGGLTHRVTDLGANVSTALPCIHVAGDPHSIDCATLLITSLIVNTGDGNDRAALNGSLVSTLSGGSGDDTLTGGNGVDSIHGGSGADTIAARDNNTDQVDCGSEADYVLADIQDTVALDCEIVDRAIGTVPGTGGGAGGGTGGGSGGGSSPGAALAGLSVTTDNAQLNSAGLFSLGVACRGNARCRGTLVAYTTKRFATPKKKAASSKKRKSKARRIMLAKRKVSIRGDKTQSLRIKLSKKTRQVFRRLRVKRVRAKVTVYYTTTAGLKGKTQRTVTLKLARR